MSRSVWRIVSTMIVAIAVTGAASSGAAAQDGAVAPHPSHIHVGTCAELDPNPTYPLTNVAAVSPDAPAGAVEVGHSTIDATLDDLLASPFAINIHESGENVANYIACGDVTGPVVDGLLLIPLHEQNESGYSGIAALASNDAGGTNVSVYLAPGLHGGDTAAVTGASTPAADAAAETTADTAEAQEVAVSIADFAFDPQVLEIPVGTTVTWTNNDSAQHTATSTDGVWDSDILAQGDSFSFTFDTPGTYDYICSLHPNMTGQIVVTG